MYGSDWPAASLDRNIARRWLITAARLRVLLVLGAWLVLSIIDNRRLMRPPRLQP